MNEYTVNKLVDFHSPNASGSINLIMITPVIIFTTESEMEDDEYKNGDFKDCQRFFRFNLYIHVLYLETKTVKLLTTAILKHMQRKNQKDLE